ncbi:lamin tail domain-containing protein, partial [Acetobacteraceae bacterium]|nr:lamin tail domain-containing protein [Candidatus Parcubacteria bacterium]
MPGSVFAAVEITQVMYDVPGTDAGREWVTVTNKGTASVDISKFKFLEGGVNHKLILTSGSALLSSGGSAIIASNAATFLSEHPGFVGAVFKSSFSLSNTGETIALINDTGAVEHSHTYIAQKKAPAASKSKK